MLTDGAVTGDSPAALRTVGLQPPLELVALGGLRSEVGQEGERDSRTETSLSHQGPPQLRLAEIRGLLVSQVRVISGLAGLIAGLS